MGPNQKGTNLIAGKIIGKEERPQKNSSFGEERRIILEDKMSACNKPINRNTRQNEQGYKEKRKEMHKIFRKKKRVLFKSKLEKMEISNNNNEAKKCCQELNIIRKGFKPQTLLIIDKEVYIAVNKEKVLQMWSEYYKKHFELHDGTDSDSEKEWTMCVQTAELHIESPNDGEMEMVTSQLKNGKATGHDQIPNTLIKEEEKSSRM
jgi:hypothetical protein